MKSDPAGLYWREWSLMTAPNHCQLVRLQVDKKHFEHLIMLFETISVIVFETVSTSTEIIIV